MKSTFQHGFSAWENGHHKWEQFSWIISCQRRRRPFDQHNSCTFFFFSRCNRGGGVHTGKYTKGKKKKKKMAQKNEIEKKKKKKREGMVEGRRQDNRTRHVSIQHRHRRVLLLSVIVTSGIFQTRAVLGSLFFSSCANQLGVPTTHRNNTVDSLFK